MCRLAAKFASNVYSERMKSKIIWFKETSALPFWGSVLHGFQSASGGWRSDWLGSSQVLLVLARKEIHSSCLLPTMIPAAPVIATDLDLRFQNLSGPEEFLE